MKQYSEGTRWAVRWAAPSGRSGLLTQSDDQGIQVKKHADYVEAAKAVDHSRWCETRTNPRTRYTYRLVRLTPKPRRTVEERIAEAVREAVRERTAPILKIVEGQREHLRRSIQQRTTEEHLDAIITLLRDLRDGKVST